MPSSNRARLRVNPGEHHATVGDVVLSTLLGSCVAACLYDPSSGVFGLNHFLLPARRGTGSELTSDAGRYGIHSMELLINAMIKLGATRRHLRAKAFGGANVLSNLSDFAAIGAMNVEFVRSFLTREGIPLVAAELGGTEAKAIYFSGSDFSVAVRSVRRIASVAQRDQKHLESALEHFQRSREGVELWLSGK